MSDLEQVILMFPDRDWNWGWISQNPNITMKDILDNPDNNWNCDYISSNSNITIKDILDNPDKPWNWNLISLNPNITMKDILDNQDKSWNWEYISENNFNYSEKKKIVKLLEKRFINRLLLRKLWIKIEELVMIKYHPDTDFIKEYVKF